MRRLALALVLSFSLAARGDLKDYKNQKHRQVETTPTGQVVTKTCEEAFLEACRPSCKGNAACLADCQHKVGPYCAERARKRSAEEGKLVLEALLLFAGPLITLIDGPRNYDNGPGDVDPYVFYWNYPSYHLDIGAGYLGNKTYGTSMSAAFRLDHFGLGANATYFTQSGDNLGELDAGPQFYLGSTHIQSGIQPSVMVSAGKGVKPEYGFGIRTDTTVYLDQVYFLFSPLLGKINGQWNFELKAGLGYRFTPLLAAHVTFEHRSVVDLDSLTVSSASLNGGFLYLGLRFN